MTAAVFEETHKFAALMSGLTPESTNQKFKHSSITVHIPVAPQYLVYLQKHQRYGKKILFEEEPD